MNQTQRNIRIAVDLTNPGQFFACCGLLELADRLWPGAEGWFETSNRSFMITAYKENPADANQLISPIVSCEIKNTMSAKDLERREQLSALMRQLRSEIKTAQAEKTVLESQLNELDNEKKALDSLWRERPILVGAPFNLQVDWFLDSFAGGSRFKTWAGQQSVIDIVRAMHSAVSNGGWDELDSAEWLSQASDNAGVPFNFDSNLGPQASSVDVGYSLDALKLSMQTRPFIEFAAFIGLQRFRPQQIDNENRYRYRAWHTPLPLRLSSIAACTFLTLEEASDFEFRLLYRTKYLKSFLPSTQTGVST